MAEFSVHLGGGLYMDSDGVLSHGPDPGKPVYATPGGGFPVNLDTLEKVFTGLANALPKGDDASRKKFDKILTTIGMAASDKEDLINALQAVGAVASVIGSVVPIVGAALAALTLLLGLFKGGPSALELLITRRFDDLARQIKALEIQIQQRDLRNQRSLISAALAAVANYVEELKNTSPDPITLHDRREEVRTQVDNAGVAVRNLLDPSTWLASFSQNEYTAVWPWLSYRLYTFPRDAAPVKAIYPAQGVNLFNHALMVPLSLFGVTSYLTLLRALTPEFRSTREHREDLWEFARSLEILAENMRGTGLARTLYTAAYFQGGATGGIPFGLDPGEVVDVPWAPPSLKPGSSRFAIGAVDLLVHNDAYFTPGFTAGPIQLPGDQFAKEGLLNVRWNPPAILERYEEWVTSVEGPLTRTRYRITNPEECAQAANAQAELDYADLLYSSGYLNLVHVVAVLRNEATDPSISQTVTAHAWLRRKPGDAVSVTVESEPILLTGVITSNARRQSQEYEATVYLTTQPLGRSISLNYKVYLRTLRSDDYSLFYQTEYVDDPDHAGCKKLVTSTVGTPLDQLLISEGKPSAQERHTSGTAVLKAITHDWWIPVKLYVPRPQPEMDFLVNLRAAGWEPTGSSASPASGPSSASDPQPVTGLLQVQDGLSLTARAEDSHWSDYIGWVDAVEPANGQRRKASENQVHLEYTLSWEADQMTVSLKNQPNDRNYVVYVVVEEKLGSGTILHTAQRIPIVGQLTYVPQSFFDKEEEAIARFRNALRDFADRYVHSISDVPHPPPGDPDPGWLGLDRQQIAGDPVLRELQSDDFNSVPGLERLAAQAAHHPPAAAILRESLAEAKMPKDSLEAFLRANKS